MPCSCGREWEELKGNPGDSFRVIRVIDSSSYFILDHPATDIEQIEPQGVGSIPKCTAMKEALRETFSTP
jgi:hypothetical protein